jgi:hypothetical protein
MYLWCEWVTAYPLQNDDPNKSEIDDSTAISVSYSFPYEIANKDGYHLQEV